MLKRNEAEVRSHDTKKHHGLHFLFFSFSKTRYISTYSDTHIIFFFHTLFPLAPEEKNKSKEMVVVENYTRTKGQTVSVCTIVNRDYRTLDDTRTTVIPLSYYRVCLYDNAMAINKPQYTCASNGVITKLP